MNATTEDRKLAPVPDPEDQKAEDQDGAEETGKEEADDAASEEQALREEQEAEQQRQKAQADAAEQLSFPVGGVRPTKALIQITGGEVEIPAHLLPDKDEEFELVVKGWVKSHKHTTEKKGGSATRTAIFVVEDVDLQRLSS